MREEYKIFDISEGSDTYYGDIVIVKANPVKIDSNGCRTHCTHTCNETDFFFFAKNSDIINNILSIANSDKIWIPDKTEYSVESVNDESDSKMIDVYFHDSVYENTPIDEDDFISYSMEYHTAEYSTNQSDFSKLDKAHTFTFGDTMIETSWGSLHLESFTKIDQGEYDFIFDDHNYSAEFDVTGRLELSKISSNLKDSDICRVAVIRKPESVFILVHMYDQTDNNVITFFGIDSMENSLSKYIDNLDLYWGI